MRRNRGAFLSEDISRRITAGLQGQRGMKFMSDPERQIQEMAKDLSRMTTVLTQLSRDSELAPISRDLQRVASSTYKAEVQLRRIQQDIDTADWTAGRF